MLCHRYSLVSRAVSACLLDGPWTYIASVLSPEWTYTVVLFPLLSLTLSPVGADWTPWIDLMYNPCFVWDCQWTPLAAPCSARPIRIVWDCTLVGEGTASVVVTLSSWLVLLCGTALLLLLPGYEVFGMSGCFYSTRNTRRKTCLSLT